MDIHKTENGTIKHNPKSQYYKKGFKDAYNNPSQYKNIDLNKQVSPNAEDFRSGVVAGYIKAQKDRIENNYSFIMSENDLKRKMDLI